jgi:hypothetical protein
MPPLCPPSFGTAGKPPSDQNAQYNCIHAAISNSVCKPSLQEKKKIHEWWVLLCVLHQKEASQDLMGINPTHNQPPATTPNPTDRPSISANTETIDASCLLGSTATRISFSYQKKMLALDILILSPAQHMPWRDIKQLSKAQLSSAPSRWISSHTAAPATRAAIIL